MFLLRCLYIGTVPVVVEFLVVKYKPQELLGSLGLAEFETCSHRASLDVVIASDVIGQANKGTG